MSLRYAYGLTAALLLGGAAATITFQPLGAQIAQNEPGTIRAATPRPDAPMSFADLANRLAPAVVNISTTQRVEVMNRMPPGFEEFFRRFGHPDIAPRGGDEPVIQEGTSLGSGFLISPDGYIVTNNHVVSPARDDATVEEIIVTLADGKEYEARLVGRDAPTDLALLKIEAENLPFVKFSPSSSVRVGDWIVAIGNPLGLGGTVTAGIVSALHRNINIGQYDRFIQTDAAINRGNSGGPMFDLNGNVVGINTALFSPTGGNIGIGFAIPADQARPIIEALRRGERVQRGYLGVGIQPVDEGIAASLGIPKNRGEIVRSVEPGSAADRAGLERGDVVISVAGRPVTPDDTLSYIVASQKPGARVPIEVIRDGERMRITATLGQRPSEEELAAINDNDREMRPLPEEEETESQRSARQRLGLTVQPLTEDIARRLRLDEDVEGLVVVEVDRNSDAARQGLQPGDIILAMNRRPVTSPEEAAQIVEQAREAGRESVLLLVRRGNRPPVFVGVGLAES